MSIGLKISFGQYSDKGRKEINQDFHGICIPDEPQLTAKGIAIALADGISSSSVGQLASEAAVAGLLEDYYCTSDAWSVKKSVTRVLIATNSWLHSQSLQSQHPYDRNKGYVCTLSALVIKSSTAHIFHIGDARVYRLRKDELEQLTTDHRLWISQDKNYLSRAMGIDVHLEVDYRAMQVNEGDIYLLTTDGVYESVTSRSIIDTLNQNESDLDTAARNIAEKAFEHGSTDNLTVQIIRIDEIPVKNADEALQQLTLQPFPPEITPRMEFDGYRIIRELHASNRSHVYLAQDMDSGRQVVIKTPSIEVQGDPAFLERFLMEEWIARRIDSAHVLKPCSQTRKRNYLYITTEFVSGITLTQWMMDNPLPKLERVRDIVEQIAKGLRAFHRLEMIHQDLRPDNIMIDENGTIKIIDFGSTRVAGIVEISSSIEQNALQGTAQYTAPEYLLGDDGSTRADLFSLGVIAYQMLTGKLPYGAQIAKTRSKAEQNKLKYDPIADDERHIPVWIDGSLRKAVNPDPKLRYQVLSEFMYDLRHPNRKFLGERKTPLIDRNPLLFWKCVCIFQMMIIILLLVRDT